MEFYVGESDTSYAPQINHYFELCSIYPSLPNGLSIDPKTGVISGTPTESISKEYEITCRNAVGSSYQTITIVVQPNSKEYYCEVNGNSYLTIVFKVINNYNNMKFTLAYSDNTPIDIFIGSEIWENGKTYTYKYCLKQDSYIVRREDISSLSEGWGGSSVSIYIYGIMIGSWTLNEGEYLKANAIACILFLYL